jgi:hypothetical protein
MPIQFMVESFLEKVDFNFGLACITGETLLFLNHSPLRHIIQEVNVIVPYLATLVGNFMTDCSLTSHNCSSCMECLTNLCSEYGDM